MSIGIIYAGKHISTKKYVEELARKLGENVKLFDLTKSKDISLNELDTVILGGSIYAGRIRKDLSKFVEANKKKLLNKKIHLFVCGAEKSKEGQEKEIITSFPEDIIKAAKSKAFFPGDFIFSELNFFEKMIAKKVAKVESDTDNFNPVFVDDIVEAIKDES